MPRLIYAPIMVYINHCMSLSVKKKIRERLLDGNSWERLTGDVTFLKINMLITGEEICLITACLKSIIIIVTRRACPRRQTY